MTLGGNISWAIAMIRYRHIPLPHCYLTEAQRISIHLYDAKLASLPTSVIRNTQPMYCKCQIFLEKLFRYSEEGAE